MGNKKLLNAIKKEKMADESCGNAKKTFQLYMKWM